MLTEKETLGTTPIGGKELSHQDFFKIYLLAFGGKFSLMQIYFQKI
jgi:hypothetical protein